MRQYMHEGRAEIPFSGEFEIRRLGDVVGKEFVEPEVAVERQVYERGVDCCEGEEGVENQRSTPDSSHLRLPY